MLIGMPKNLSPDILHLLNLMGHGDKVAIVDRNFPASSHTNRLCYSYGAGIAPVLQSVLEVIPLDYAVENRYSSCACRRISTIYPPYGRNTAGFYSKRDIRRTALNIWNGRVFMSVRHSATLSSKPEKHSAFQILFCRKGSSQTDVRIERRKCRWNIGCWGTRE